MSTNPSNTIVFITGAFVHHSCWKQWQAYFESQGYRTIAPAWPYKDASPEELRNSQPNTAIAGNRLAALTDYFANIVARMPEKAILIGHSMGGLIVQLLLQRGLGSAGVAIHSVPPQGVMTFKLSFLRAGWGGLGFFTSVKKAYLMSFKTWKYAFTNEMDCDAQKEGYYQLAIPESKLIVRDTLTAAARIKFDAPHPPLLLTSGSIDHAIPASLNYANYKRYRHRQSVTEYKEFEGRNHFVLGQASWAEDARFIFDWLEKNLK
jgi:pimeloyl-ACP methyl ester carboxylesterase